MEKIIYKKDSKGKIRIIKAYTDGDKLIQLSGILDGNLVKNEKICKPKNIGKINETSGEEQAILELESFIKKKLKKDYFETLEEAQNNIKLLPTLAKNLKDHYGKIDNNQLQYKTAYVQPKLDGQRALTTIKDGKVTIMSRSGSEIENMDHIKEQLLNMGFNNIILDGELYVHSRGVENFQEIMSAIKKYQPGLSEKVNLCVYDIVDENKTFKERFIDFFGEDELKQEMLSNIKEGFNNVKKVFTYKVKNFEDILDSHDIFVDKGFEGTIVRWGEQGYEVGKRSEKLLKYKDFKDRTAVVLDVIPSEARPNQGVLVCRFNEIDTDTGEEGNMIDTFKAALKTDIAGKEDLLKNKDKYIGLTAEIVFQKYTDKGLPTGGMYAKGFRNDK